MLYQTGDERIHYYLQEESFNQKKDLLFLKDKTKDELKKYGNILTDIQKKWLEQLETSHWDWELFEKNIRIKQFEKKNKTQKMGMYINSFSCRRQFILNYFSNSYQTVKQEVCCDKCQLEIPKLEEEFDQKKYTEMENDSKEILKKIFLI